MAHPDPATLPLSRATCLIHLDRSASARCPICGQFYCSECITEHEGKLTCARCLENSREVPEEKEARLSLPLMPVVHLLFATAASWGIYYLVAHTLASIPDSFHDGTIWESGATEPAGDGDE